MLKQQLQQKLQQKLSPAQIQVIKMLEIPVLELEERILQELEENPALEEGNEVDDNSDVATTENTEDSSDTNEDITYDYDQDDYNLDDDLPEYRLKTNNTSKETKRDDIPFSVGITFHEFLMNQLGLLHLSEKERILVEYIIGNIDEEGYLRRDAESMVDDISFSVGVSVNDEEMKRLIKIVQQLDPHGVGATNLQECLLLQLERKEPTRTVKYAIKIISDYFEEFSKKHYEKIMRGLSIDDNTLKDVIAEIVRLNPKPGNSFDSNALESSLSIIVPDFIVENHEGKLSVLLNNSNVPELKVNGTYNEMLQDYTANKDNQTREMKDAMIFVKQKIESARWFIDAIRQRQVTLLTTMSAIVDAQKEFFLEGDDAYLKPMILKDISDVTGYDISTISRVSNSKYVQTEFGIFPLKYFFSESMTNDEGEEVSTREIKKILQEVVDAEDKQKPLNDDLLAEVLKNKGYPIARRTIAKYRDQLNIPVARLRKTI